MTISKLEPGIEGITHDLLNPVIEKGNMDLINDLAYPLPVTVIVELLGVPLQDRDTFRIWADKLVSSAGNNGSTKEGIWSLLSMLAINAAVISPACGMKYATSGLTLLMYSSSFFRKSGSCTILFPAYVGILAQESHYFFHLLLVCSISKTF
jgi:hypothetical protein